MSDADVFYSESSSPASTPASAAASYSDPSLAMAAGQTDAASDAKLSRFLWGSNGFSFHSLLEAMNPLQYIPGVSTLYREETGDSIGAVASAIGSTLIGGPIGAVTSLADSLFEAGTGKDVGGHLYAMLFGDDKPSGNNSSAPPSNLAAASASQGKLPGGATEIAGLPWLTPSQTGAAGPQDAKAVAGAIASLPTIQTPPATGGAAAPLIAGLPKDVLDPSTATAAGDADGGNTEASPAPSAMPPAPAASSPAAAAKLPAPAATATPLPTATNGRIPPDFVLRMMNALDKYQASAKLHDQTPPTMDVGG